jgi:hypothetical protein
MLAIREDGISTVIVVTTLWLGPTLGTTQLPIQWVLGAVLTEVKWLEHKANDSSPSSARMKNEWAYLSPPLYLI